MEVPLCCFPGCKKLAWRDADGKQHECCGMFHHVLLMERRAAGEDGSSSSDDSSLDDGVKCQLPSCGNAAKEGHQFCSKSCVLERLREAARSSSWKKCKLPGCSMPAYVEKTLLGVRVHDFCGWTHAKEASFLSAETGTYKVPVELSEADIAKALWEWACHGIQGEVKVDADFYKKHPWDIIPPNTSTTYVIAKLNRNSKSRKRSNTTEKGSYWKQQGREDSFKFRAADVVKKHRTYITGEQKSNVRFTLIEYVLDGNGETGDWAVCKVSRKACSEPKVKKARRSKRTKAAANRPEASVVDPVEASETADPVEASETADPVANLLNELPDMMLMEFPEIEFETV